jgi:hypothetical protein
MVTQSNLVRVVFHRRGRDVETSWCEPLAKPHHYRLLNILFLHASPCFSDVIEARPSRSYDGMPAFRRVVKSGGRYPMIVDYPKRSDFKKLGAALRSSLEIMGEGCYPPQDGEPGRVYLAVPRRHSPARVLAAARRAVPGVIAVHPEIEEKAPRTTPPSQPAKTKAKSAPRGPERLFEAIRSDDRKAFEKVSRSDLAARDEHHWSLLSLAVAEGRTEIVKRLLAAGADPNPKGKDRAPLIAAALRNRPREAKLLLEAGADPARAVDRDGDPVLVAAAFRESLGVVRALLAVPHPEKHKSLALLEAAGVGSLPIVKLLVRHGANPLWKSARGNSALSIAKKKRKRDIVAYFAGL